MQPTLAPINVPLLDLNAQNSSIQEEWTAAIESVTSKSQFALGPAVQRFEEAFADYVGVDHAIGVNNGTSALQLALQACNVGPGDEVITTPHTWISTSWAISYVGAKPVYVDIDPTTYNIDPDMVAAAITPKTKAILPVHLYGQACDLEPLLSLAEQHNLTLIEDAAQAHGAYYQGKRVGSHGRVGCFSFYPGKNLGAFGEAGGVVTNDQAIADRVRRLRDHAQDGRHNHVEIGYNARMEGIQGAVLDVKLRHLNEWTAQRQQNAARLSQLLAGTPGLVLPANDIPEGHVWHLYVVLVDAGIRQTLMDKLRERGVGAAIHYPTLVPMQPVYAHLGYQSGQLPIAEDVASRCLSLPMFPELTDTQLEHVATSLSDCLAEM